MTDQKRLTAESDQSGQQAANVLSEAHPIPWGYESFNGHLPNVKFKPTDIYDADGARILRVGDAADSAQLAKLITNSVNILPKMQASHAALMTALEILLVEAEGFSVSGVYFSEDCMGHKGPALARAALANANSLAESSS